MPTPEQAELKKVDWNEPANRERYMQMQEELKSEAMHMVGWTVAGGVLGRLAGGLINGARALRARFRPPPKVTPAPIEEAATPAPPKVTPAPIEEVPTPAIRRPKDYTGVFQTDKGLAELGRDLALPRRVTDLSALRGKDVVDIGGGGGQLVRELREVGARAHAVDLQAGAFRARGLKNNDHFIQGDATQLPIASGSQDVAYSNWSVFYYEKDSEILTRALSEVSRVLRPGGEARLVGVDPATLRLLDRVPELEVVSEAPMLHGISPALVLRKR
jgi:2-polyprenyl-3-methyl-5-hydroxy-6-metoxy-1,4-benzoquinol methylase